MNKIIITKQNHQILTAVWNQDQVAQLNLEDEESESLLNNIYIGKVKNVTKNIDAAFIDLGGGQMAYYSLMENKRHLFASSPKDSAQLFCTCSFPFTCFGKFLRIIQNSLSIHLNYKG